MHKIISSLIQHPTFSITYGERRYDAHALLAIVTSVAHEISAHVVSRDAVVLFCPRNNWEAFIALCANSLLGTTCAMATQHNVGQMAALIPPARRSVVVASPRMALPVTDMDVVHVRFDRAAPTPPGTQARLLDTQPPAHVVFMTSGTTGRPKLILYREDALLSNAMAVTSYLALDEHSVSLCIFPVHYMYGLSTTLCALVSGSALHYLRTLSDTNTVCDYVVQWGVNVLPVLGDWMIDMALGLHQRKYRVTHLLNASDRLLTNQALKGLTCCEVLWNNFGQTESGPRLLFNRLTRPTEVAQRSLNGVVAPGFVMSADIHTALQPQPDMSADTGELVYQTPHAMQGYLDPQFNLLPCDPWIASGDLFTVDDTGCHFWIRRLKEDLKVNGRFFPSGAIYNEFVDRIGVIKCIFAKDQQGVLRLYIDGSATPDHNIRPRLIEDIIHEHWRHSSVHVVVKPTLDKTSSGKIRLVQH